MYTSSTLHIRLTFWFLLYCVLYSAIGDLQERAPLYYIPLDIGATLLALLFHEMGHAIFARAVGGNHWEWVIWPLGGMVAPTAPRRPWPTFVANIGGIVFSLLLAALALTCVWLVDRTALHFFRVMSLPAFAILPNYHMDAGILILLRVCDTMAMTSIVVTLFNFFPCYWFDGGYIWQSILWPFLGLYRAIMITCMAGMVLAVPLFFMSMYSLSFLGMVMWALVFSACFTKRRELKAAGPGIVPGEDDDSYNYMDTSTDRPKRRGKKGWFKAAAKKAARERAEQAQIDAILAKVHDKGLHSLSWFEKRALKKATERQRQRDLAERL
jgi:Zn-dependent protease